MTTRAPRDASTSCPDCGWTSKVTTAGLAAKALRGHSCGKYRALQERIARGRARRAAVDRRPKPCTHKQARHQHGTRACYVLDKCRCRPCARANAENQRRVERLTGYGTWQPYVDAQPARDHIEQLRAAGMGLKRIATAASLSHSTLTKLVYGKRMPDGTYQPTAGVRPDTEQRILAVTAHIDTLGAHALVDGTGTRRRLQALVALGWSQRKLSIALDVGHDGSNFGRLIGAPVVHAATARAVRDLYNQLSMQLPPATNQRERISVNRSRNYAAARGWLPPLALDDDTLDIPEDQRDLDLEVLDDVDHVAVARTLAGERVPLTHDDKLEVTRQLLDQGHGAGKVSEVLHVNGNVARALVDEAHAQPFGEVAS